MLDLNTRPSPCQLHHPRLFLYAILCRPAQTHPWNNLQLSGRYFRGTQRGSISAMAGRGRNPTGSPITPPVLSRSPRCHARNGGFSPGEVFSTAEPSNRRRNRRRGLDEHRAHNNQGTMVQTSGYSHEQHSGLQVLHTEGSGGTTPRHGRSDREPAEKGHSPRVSSRVAQAAQDGRRRRDCRGTETPARTTGTVADVGHSPAFLCGATADTPAAGPTGPVRVPRPLNTTSQTRPGCACLASRRRE